MMPELPKRKPIRLPDFDYNSSGAYFITVCTKDKACILSTITVGATIGRPPVVHMTEIGRVVMEGIHNIPDKYPLVNVDHYVIMPNHIHMLLVIEGDFGRPMVAPTISSVVNQMKGYVTKTVGFPIWQKSFYEHVVRTYRDYQAVCEYIDNNPARWAEDKYYC